MGFACQARRSFVALAFGDDTDDASRHLHRSQSLRRRARPLRAARGGDLSRLAIDPAGAEPGPRPEPLRDLGAGQTIDQTKLYGTAAKWFLEVDEHPATPERVRWLRQLACRAFWTATGGRPGPVHLNFSLREPLVLDEPLPEDAGGRAG